MAFSSIDRTAEVESSQHEVSVASAAFCCYYEKHPDTFLQRKECWTCVYGDFGIESGKVSETGICNYILHGPNTKGRITGVSHSGMM